MTSQIQTDVLHVFYLLPTISWTLESECIRSGEGYCLLFCFFACVPRGLIVIGELLSELCLHMHTLTHTLRQYTSTKVGKKQEKEKHVFVLLLNSRPF